MYNLQRLRDAYLDTLQLSAFISIPIAGGIFILAPESTEIFLGAKWMPMVPAMQVLCIFGATRSFGATTGPLFHGVGKPKILTNLAMLQLLILVVIIYPLTKQWGLIGISVAVVIPNIITQSVAAYQVIHITEAKISNFSKSLFLPFIGTFVMIMLVLFFKDFFEICLSGFLIHIFIGITIYLGIIYMLDLICGSYYKRMVLGLIKSLH